VTDTHVLVCSATEVHAVSLEARESAWSYPIAGHLALADGNLYVASADGAVTAIAMPASSAVALESLEISGPTEVVEASSAHYRAIARYVDGHVQEQTLSSRWSVTPPTYANIDASGDMTAAELIRPAEDVLVRARYEENGRSVDAALNVRLVVGVSIPDLIRRNLAESLELKGSILHSLDVALERERAARALGWSPALREAIRREVDAKQDITVSMRFLRALLKKHSTGGPAPAKGPKAASNPGDPPKD
jgi:hypothetical protein